jgi:hypothetical protein
MLFGACCDAVFAFDLEQEHLTAMMEVLERGPNWWHVRALLVGLDPRDYNLVPVRAVVESGRLREFARTPQEKAFFANNIISSLYAPDYAVPQEGYNSGNLLIGKL